MNEIMASVIIFFYLILKWKKMLNDFLIKIKYKLRKMIINVKMSFIFSIPMSKKRSEILKSCISCNFKQTLKGIKII